MLATLCLLPLLHLPLSYAATKILDVSDSSLVFSPGWSQEFSVFSTDSFGGSLTASLPDSASSVTYVGFNIAGGSMYGYTIDCDTDCVLQTVNASQPSLGDGDIASEPATLFSIELDPTTQHILRVYNIPSDADDGSSQINFDHLNVSVQDNAVSVLTGILQVPISSTVTTASASASSTSSTSRGTVKVSPSSAGRGATSGSVPAVTSSATSLSPSSSASVDDHPSTAANPVLPAASSAPSSAASSSGRVSKSVIVGATVLSIVFAGCFVATLVVFLRQRRQKRNNYASSQSGSLSPTGSIIPIMAPPQMRTASLNPFSDPTNPPPGERVLDSPSNSSLMQRRMEGRSASPGAPPSIPLPDVPLDRRPKMESRSNSPATAFARNDLWIARTPVKSQFSAV